MLVQYLRFVFKNYTLLKGTRKEFTTSEKSSPQPEIKVHLEFRLNLRCVLLDIQSFTEKPVAFAHLIVLFFSCLVKNSIDLGDMQISYEIIHNAHVCQLTVSP